MDDALVIAGKRFGSRLLIGTGKYPSFEVMKRCHEASGAEIVTVAVRRLDLNAKGEASLLHWIDTSADDAPAQHRRLLHRRRRGAHLPPGATSSA